MKKIISIILVSATAVLHSGCEKSVNETVAGTGTPAAAEEAKTSSFTEEESAVAGKTRVNVEGTATLASNNTHYLVNVSGAPAEIHDKLNEFNGAVFKAKNNGLYYVSANATFNQRNKDNDQGDGFTGSTIILNQSGNIIARSWGKIPPNEVNGGPGFISVAPSVTMVYLKAGQTLSFKLHTFGSTGNVVGKYSILIYSLD